MLQQLGSCDEILNRLSNWAKISFFCFAPNLMEILAVLAKGFGAMIN